MSMNYEEFKAYHVGAYYACWHNVYATLEDYLISVGVVA